MIIQKNGIIRNINENRWPEYKAKGYVVEASASAKNCKKTTAKDGAAK